MTKRFMMVLLAFLTIGMQVFAQNSVAGKVTDESGEPLVGASVLVKGTHTGTVTDLDGNYKLAGVSSSSVLVFSSIGYKTVEATVGNQKNIYIVLPEDTEYLDDVVVVGYGTARRKDVSGAISSLNYAENKDVATLPNPNALAALSSRVAGLSYSPTSTAGGDNTATMTIRGKNAIPTGGSNSANAQSVNQPLLVIDGVLSYGSINSINTADIQSIDVLKDASAAAIYGSRAANGVIIITTKSGQSDKPVVNFNASVSLSDWSRMPKMVTDKETFLKNRFYSKQAPENSAYSSFKDKSWGDYANLDAAASELLSAREQMAWKDGQWVNWLDEISRTGIGQKYDVSVGGKAKNVSYYISSDYTRQQGIRKGDDYEKAGAMGKVDINITDWLTVGAKANYLWSNSWGQTAKIQNAIWMSPLSYVYAIQPGYENWYNSVPDGGSASPYWGAGANDSNLWTKRESHSANLNGVAYAQIDFPFIPGLSYKITLQGQRNASYSDVFNRPEISVSTEKTTDMDNPGQYNNASSGSSSTSNYSAWNIDNILTYGKDFGKNHIDAMIGYTREYTNSNGLTVGFSGFNTPTTLLQYNLSTANSFTPNRTRVETSAVGYLARANYNYANKYYLTANFRRDGYSAFAAGHKWGNFFGASAAWVISNENFMKNQNAFDFLKLRLSWGQNGSRSISAGATQSTVNKGTGNDGNNTMSWLGDASALGMAMTNVPNPNLTWATIEKYDLGIDFAMAQNRINGSIDLYTGATKNMLVNRSAPYFSGFTSVNDNVGKVTNKGIEISLNTVNINGNGRDSFRWESNFVFDSNANKIVSLFGPDYNGNEADDIANTVAYGYDSYLALLVGYPIGAAYDLKKLGVFQNQNEIDTYVDSKGNKIQPKAVPGDIKFLDYNNDGKIDSNDRHYIGSPDPLFTINFANTLAWKNFSLYFNFRWAQGNETHFLWFDPYAHGTSMAGGNQLAQIKPWMKEGDGDAYPRYGWDASTQNTALGKFGYQFWNPRSFLKLKDLSLSYNVPEKVISHIGLQGLRVYVAATDLFTITNWSGLDPENAGTIAAGIGSDKYGSNGTYKTVTAGVNITFGGSGKSVKEANNSGAALAAALAAADAAKAKAAGLADENAKLQKALQDANNALAACEAQPKNMAQKRAEALLVEDIYFDLNKSVIKDNEAYKVDELIKALKANPDASIEIYGYADQATGTAQRNLMLTKERALVVAEALKAAGIAASRISTEFYGTEKDSSFTPENNRLAVCIVK
ncbi:MAG: SusC/RagA family TonB-linked outer membrane protein [Bacteroidales bacterium]|nr:SusC/RagA family TonB-linked outer membrane protein [Bacteroidales bacterium]